MLLTRGGSQRNRYEFGQTTKSCRVCTSSSFHSDCSFLLWCTAFPTWPSSPSSSSRLMPWLAPSYSSPVYLPEVLGDVSNSLGRVSWSPYSSNEQHTTIPEICLCVWKFSSRRTHSLRLRLTIYFLAVYLCSYSRQKCFPSLTISSLATPASLLIDTVIRTPFRSILAYAGSELIACYCPVRPGRSFEYLP